MATIFLPLCGLGVLVLFGGFGAYFLYEAYRGRQQASASQGWPTAAGQVTAAQVRQLTNYSEHGSSVAYAPAVEYAYSVLGQPFTGDRITFGLDETHAKRAKAEEVLARYPVGGTVTVHYDPNNPSDAVLEQRAGASAAGWIFGALFLLVGLCVGCLLIGMGFFLTRVGTVGG